MTTSRKSSPASRARGADEIPFVVPVEVPPVVVLVPAPPVHRASLGGAVRWLLGLVASLWEWVFGTATLMLGLAVLAAIPLLQFLTLGYLLDVGGRVGRTGRLRDGFIGVRPAARVGSIFLGAGLMLLPLQFISSLWQSAELIDPGGRVAQGWKIALTLLTLLMAGHIALACARGGRLRYFFWPPGHLFWIVRRLRRGGYYREARDAVWEFAASLRLPYFFWLGCRGFVGGFLWLALPVTLLALGRQVPPLGLLGWVLLVAAFLYVPFLQIHFAAQGRFRALFELGAVRELYRRAPWAFAWSFLIALALALPLYLLKIEMIPREAAWLPSLVFITFIFPARLLTGWGYGRALRRPVPRHWLFRVTGRLGMVVVAMVYGVIVYFTQYIAWGGIWSLYEQHAFLLPVPFLSM